MKEELEKILSVIASNGGDTTELYFDPGASESELVLVEKELGHTIPEEFRKVLTDTSSYCGMLWHLPRGFVLPEMLDSISSGGINWGLNLIIECNKSKNSWAEGVFNFSEGYNKVWQNKFAFQETDNGDFLAIDLNKSSYGKIVYLSHDDGEGHGYVMANSFSELLSNWGKLGFVGPEYWQWLPFTADKESGILPNCDNAKVWKELIGLTKPEDDSNELD